MYIGHDEEWNSLYFAGSQDSNDVRMLQLRDREDLRAEAARGNSARNIGWQNLDHDLSRQLAILREIDVRHSPANELALDVVVLAQLFTYPVGDGLHYGGVQVP